MNSLRIKYIVVVVKIIIRFCFFHIYIFILDLIYIIINWINIIFTNSIINYFYFNRFTITIIYIINIITRFFLKAEFIIFLRTRIYLFVF